MPFTIIDGGDFTSTGVGVKLNLPASADYFVARNLTQAATTQNPGRGVKFEWWKGLTADDNAQEIKKTNSTDALNEVAITSGGFTYVTALPEAEAEVTGTTITAATPAVCSATNTYVDGDRVRIYNSTGMLQIGGMEFSISSTSGSAFTLLGLPAAGFAAAASAFKVRRVSSNPAVAPQYLFVTAVSKAANAVVTVSTNHDYVVDQLVHFSVPASFGMTQLDQLTGKVTAIGTNTITVDIDSQAFATFAFPASTESPTARLFATMSPAGQRNAYNVTTVPFRTGQFLPYMFLAAGAQSPAGSTSDVIAWQAFKYET